MVIFDLVRGKQEIAKPVITGECFVHRFKWEIVESGEYEFQGIKMTITRKPTSIQVLAMNMRANGLNLDGVEFLADWSGYWMAMDSHSSQTWMLP